MTALWLAVTVLAGGASGGEVTELGSFDAAPNLPAAEGFEAWVQQLACDTDGYVYAVVGSRVVQSEGAAAPARSRVPVLNKLGPTGDLVWSVRVESQLDSSAAAPLRVVDMAWSSEGYVVVLMQDRLITFDADDGKYLTEWGGKGGGASQFYSPTCIAVDSGGGIHVCDQPVPPGPHGVPGCSLASPGRLQTFTNEGSPRAWHWWCLGTSVAVDSVHGSLYAVGPEKGSWFSGDVGPGMIGPSLVPLPAIVRYDLRRSTVPFHLLRVSQGWPTAWGSPPVTNAQLMVDPEGRLYAYNSVSILLSASGSPAGPWSEVGEKMGAADLACDPEGNLLVPRGRTIVRLARPD